MAQLSRKEFDAIEFDAARTGDFRSAALRMAQLATTSARSGDMSSAEAHLRAGEQWLLADRPAEAADSFRQALADGGATVIDARVSLARALFLLGENEEAKQLISELEAGGRRDPRQCDLVAELLVEQSDLIGALDWANTGVQLCLSADAGTGQAAPAPGTSPAPGTPPAPATSPGPGGSPGARGAGAPGGLVPLRVPPAVDRNELRMLLSLRYRIRNDMGLSEDDYDKLLDDL